MSKIGSIVSGIRISGNIMIINCSILIIIVIILLVLSCSMDCDKCVTFTDDGGYLNKNKCIACYGKGNNTITLFENGRYVERTYKCEPCNGSGLCPDKCYDKYTIWEWSNN